MEKRNPIKYKRTKKGEENSDKSFDKKDKPAYDKKGSNKKGKEDREYKKSKTDKKGGYKKYDRSDSSDEKKGGFKKYDRDKKDGYKKYDKDKKRGSYKKYDDESEKREYKKYDKNRKFSKGKYSKENKTVTRGVTEEMRLNRFIAHAGVCSRREADDLIASGTIKVNGKVVTEMGVKVKRSDTVTMGGQKLSAEKLVYVLLNKPKGFVSTTKDPHATRTVMQLVRNSTKERIYPVGRLDKDTTGLLLFTNDGTMAKKLTHPKHGIKKVYHVFTDKNVSKDHLEQLVKGVQLEDGNAFADQAAFVGNGENKQEIGLEMHIGKNRVVRRMFEALGYKVVKLDRVIFANLTKKNLPRGKWKILSEQEVGFLQQIVSKN